jgi:hypothetical protein
VIRKQTPIRAGILTFEDYLTLWLDQNVGAGPPLRKDEPEALELAEELLSDAAHAGYDTQIESDRAWILHLVVDARNQHEHA